MIEIGDVPSGCMAATVRTRRRPTCSQHQALEMGYPADCFAPARLIGGAGGLPLLRFRPISNPLRDLPPPLRL